jgi:ankyrin repeat protein
MRRLLVLVLVLALALAQQSPDQKLREALAADDLEAAKEALAEGADPNLPTHLPGPTSLFAPGWYSWTRYLATKDGWSSHAELQLLLEAGANPNAAIPTGYYSYRTPLLDAVQTSDIDAVRILLAAGAKAEVEDGIVADDLGVTPLMATAYANWETVADQLEAAQGILAVSPRTMAATDLDDRTALEYAVEAQQVELVRFLLEWCSQQEPRLIPESGGFEVRPPSGCTSSLGPWGIRRLSGLAKASDGMIGPKSQAQYALNDPARRLEITRLLLAHGTKPVPIDIRDAVRGLSYMSRPAKSDDQKEIRRKEEVFRLESERAVLLIANVVHSSHLEYDDGATPLVVAARRQLNEVAQALIQGGASLDAPDHAGKTALIYATQNRDLELVTALLEAGAKPNRSDLEDKTALDYAREMSDQELVELLEGARP